MARAEPTMIPLLKQESNSVHKTAMGSNQFGSTDFVGNEFLSLVTVRLQSHIVIARDYSF